MGLPVTIIGGFLGSGKTTLINEMLRQANGVRIAVLVNEFGELAVDEDLIEARDDKLISITGGCICCAFGDNLVGALMDLSSYSPQPDHIVIETSGVAIPSSIAASVGLLSGVELNGVVVLADAETVRNRSTDKYMGDTILRQLIDADLTVITKCDLISGDQASEVHNWIASLNHKAAVIQSNFGSVPGSVLLGTFQRQQNSKFTQHHDAFFKSTTIIPEHGVNAAAFAERLSKGDFGVIRAKGCVADHSGQKMLIQIVGQRAQVSLAKEDQELGVVCIGTRQGLKIEELNKHLASLAVVG